MAMKNFVTGEILTESDLDIYCVNTVFAEKSANESVTSSTTLQNDDHLALALAANSTYEVTGLLNTDGASTGDIKISFTGPSGAGLLLYITGPTLNASVGSDIQNITMESFGEVPQLGTTTVGEHRPIRFAGKVKIAGTAGTMQLQWAQVASNAAATRVLIDSYIWARRIN